MSKKAWKNSDLTLAFVSAIALLSLIVYAQTLFTEDLPAEDYALYNSDFDDYLKQHLESVFGEDFMQNHNEALEMAEVILDSFSLDSHGRAEFPQYFGGQYIDGNGNLVILVADPYDLGQAALGMTRFDGLNVRTVEFAYAELHRVTDVIVTFWLENWDNPECPISGYIGCVSIDTIGNRVLVSLADIGYRAVKLFTIMVIDHPAVVFIQRVDPETPEYIPYSSY